MKKETWSQLTLREGGVLLRSWKVEEAAWYLRARDSEVFRWTTEKREFTLAEAEDGIRRANENPHTICLAILDDGCTKIHGNIALVLADDAGTSAEIMYWIAPWARGKRLATRSLRRLCRWAIESLGLKTIRLKTHRDNVRSQLVAERTGFRRTKRVQGAEPVKDHVWFELTWDA
jgi:RimJ/RimL family protein N-acetyltransferase